MNLNKFNKNLQLAEIQKYLSVNGESKLFGAHPHKRVIYRVCFIYTLQYVFCTS